MEKQKKPTLTRKLNNFIADWSRFPIDLWWRKRYNIPFGSPQHRSMNFIDMAIEYQEELLWNKARNRPEEITDDEFMEKYVDEQLQEQEKKTVEMTQEEIDEDFDNLNLEEFDVK